MSCIQLIGMTTVIFSSYIPKCQGFIVKSLVWALRKPYLQMNFFDYNILNLFSLLFRRPGLNSKSYESPLVMQFSYSMHVGIHSGSGPRKLVHLWAFLVDRSDLVTCVAGGLVAACCTNSWCCLNKSPVPYPDCLAVKELSAELLQAEVILPKIHTKYMDEERLNGMLSAMANLIHY